MPNAEVNTSRASAYSVLTICTKGRRDFFHFTCKETEVQRDEVIHMLQATQRRTQACLSYCSPKWHLTVWGDIFSCHNWVEGTPGISRGYSPEMQPNTLQCTGELPPPTENDPAHNIGSEKGENPASKPLCAILALNASLRCVYLSLLALSSVLVAEAHELKIAVRRSSD